MNEIISQDTPITLITPEGALVANTYLEMGCDAKKTAKVLDMQPHDVYMLVSSRNVKEYVNGVISAAGIRSMDKITEKMQELIDKKLDELDELDMGSTKDPADLLMALHKMEEAKQKLINARMPKENNVSQDKNTQVNIFGADDNSQYARLMRSIVEGK